MIDMSQLFNDDVVLGADKFAGDISKWDVSRVTDMGYMFYKVPSLNGEISNWDVSRLTNIDFMFYKASSFNGDISKWDVSRVTNMEYMFFGASSFAQTLCGAWLTSTADKNRMFDDSPGRLCTISMTTSTTTSAPDSKGASTNTLTQTLTEYSLPWL